MMKNVPHWQLLMLLYFIAVAVPVWLVHSKLKIMALRNRNFGNLFIYIVSVIGAAFIMHGITMWLYFTFFFTVKN